jgi:alpha-tubulin suppressor-like RCC1 family protein
LSGEPGTPHEETAIHDESAVAVPKRVALQGVRYVAAGSHHTVAVTDEEVYAWGSNTAGQLGLRSFINASMPSEVVDMAGKGVCQVSGKRVDGVWRVCRGRRVVVVVAWVFYCRKRIDSCCFRVVRYA